MIVDIVWSLATISAILNLWGHFAMLGACQINTAMYNLYKKCTQSL